MSSQCASTEDWPDDGIDQDGDGSDRLLTDATAVFVAPPEGGGDDAQDGSRAHPVATLVAAAQIAMNTGKDIALAAGTYSGDGADVRGHYVFGGYEPATWRRDPALFESRVEVTQPFLAGGLPDSVLMVPGRSGALDGVSVSGDFDGPLVNDLDVYGTATASIHNCTLDCPSCSEIVRLSNMVDVQGSRIYGGRTGIRADGRGSLSVQSRVRICGNEVVGSQSYEYGIRIGLESRGPLLVRGNALTLVDGASTGIRVDRVNTAYAASDALYSQMHVVENLIQGSAGVGISTANPQEVGRNRITLSGNDSVGIYVANATGATALGDALVAIVGNMVGVGAAGVQIESPSQVVLRMVNNSVRGRRAFWISGAPGSYELTVVNNVLDATGTEAAQVDGSVLPGLSSIALHSNDLRASACLLRLTSIAGCLQTTPELDACAWAGCTAASENVSLDPQYASATDLHLGAGSPLIDLGRDPGPYYAGWLTAVDVDGEQRPQADWDIGADER